MFYQMKMAFIPLFMRAFMSLKQLGDVLCIPIRLKRLRLKNHSLFSVGIHLKNDWVKC